MGERRGFKPADRSKCILVRAVRSTDLDDRWTLAGRSLDDANQWDLRMIYSLISGWHPIIEGSNRLQGK